MLVVACLVGLAGLATWLARDYFTVGVVALPDVVGLPFENAQRVLRSSDLDVNTYNDNVPTLDPGLVTSQSPGPGTVVRRGRTVDLGVNAPPEVARVPTLVGLDVGEAEQIVRDLGRAVGLVAFVASERAPGVVVSQSPSAGSALQIGQPLALEVSRGPEVRLATVPDVRGLDVGEARRRLEAEGFGRVEAIATDISFDAPGRVEAQRPSPGVEVPVSAAVTLEYALSSGAVVAVPDLAGRSLWRAQLALRARGLRVGPVTYVQRDDAPSGVVATNPWTFTVPGAPIALTINGQPGGANFLLDAPDAFDPPADEPTTTAPDRDGPSEGAASPAPGTPRSSPGTADPLGTGQRIVPFSFDPATLGMPNLLTRPYRLELLVRDDDGERKVIDREVAAGERVSASVRVTGDDVLLQTFIDGAPFQAWRP